MDIIKFKRKMVSELSEYGKVKNSSIRVSGTDNISYIEIEYEHSGWDRPFDIEFRMWTKPGYVNVHSIDVLFYFQDGRWTTAAYHMVNKFNEEWLVHKCYLGNGYVGFRNTGFSDLIGDALSAFDTNQLVSIIIDWIKFVNKLVDKYQFREELEEENIKYTPQQLLNGEINVPDTDGVYILHNQINNQYYVGQSTHVISRLKQHSLGNGGNANVYADYKYGAPFDIEIHLLPDGETLNHLEAHYIAVYNAYVNGYNKTKGNSD